MRGSTKFAPSNGCAIPSCDRRGRLTRGWCDRHYKRYQRHGNPLFVTMGKPFNKRGPGTCNVEGCEEDRVPYKSNGHVSFSPLCYIHVKVRVFKALLKRNGWKVKIEMTRF